MRHFIYIGKKIELVGETALGRFEACMFLVRVDSIDHPYAFGWWPTKRSEWVEDTYLERW